MPSLSTSMTASRRHTLPSFREPVFQLRLGCFQLPLEHFDTSAAMTQLTSYAATADPGGGGAKDKSRQQEQQGKEVQRQVDQER